MYILHLHKKETQKKYNISVALRALLRRFFAKAGAGNALIARGSRMHIEARRSEAKLA